MLCAYAADPWERGKYATRYLNTILGYSNIPEMSKRPYATNKRHLLSAYSNLAISAEAIGKDLATSYFHEFQKLLKAYPEALAPPGIRAILYFRQLLPKHQGLHEIH